MPTWMRRKCFKYFLVIIFFLLFCFFQDWRRTARSIFTKDFLFYLSFLIFIKFTFFTIIYFDFLAQTFFCRKAFLNRKNVDNLSLLNFWKLRGLQRVMVTNRYYVVMIIQTISFRTYKNNFWKFNKNQFLILPQASFVPRPGWQWNKVLATSRFMICLHCTGVKYWTVHIKYVQGSNIESSDI